MNSNKNLRSRKNQRGFTLLEYCAGAAVLAGFIFLGMTALGTSMEKFLGDVGTWVEGRSAKLNTPK